MQALSLCGLDEVCSNTTLSDLVADWLWSSSVFALDCLILKLLFFGVMVMCLVSANSRPMMILRFLNMTWRVMNWLTFEDCGVKFW